MVVSIICYFRSYLGKMPNLTNIFQGGSKPPTRIQMAWWKPTSPRQVGWVLIIFGFTCQAQGRGQHASEKGGGERRGRRMKNCSPSKKMPGSSRDNWMVPMCCVCVFPNLWKSYSDIFQIFFGENFCAKGSCWLTFFWGWLQIMISNYHGFIWAWLRSFFKNQCKN